MLAPNPDYVDLSEPSLKGLIYLLRHRELWPKTFNKWSFSDHSSCAIGLAYKTWPELGKWYVSIDLGAKIGLDRATSEDLFLRGNKAYGTPGHEYITPEMVANKLEEYV